jgi:hypothetical protein
MIDIKPNLAEAVAFAVSLPTDQAHLCAIHPAGNRPVVGQSFPTLRELPQPSFKTLSASRSSLEGAQ